MGAFASASWLSSASMGLGRAGSSRSSGTKGVAVALFGNVAELQGDVGVQGFRCEAPGPVVFRYGGRVHAAFAAEVQQILDGDEADGGNGAFGGPDQRPDHIVFVRERAQIGEEAVAVDLRCGAPPAEGGVVVVCSGVDDHVGDIFVRQVQVGTAAREAELQHAHTGQIEVGAELFNFFGDDSQVFRDKGKRAPERGFQAIKECVAGCFDPLTVDGGFLAGVDAPVGLKTAKVIEPQADRIEGEAAASPGPPTSQSRAAQ